MTPKQWRYIRYWLILIVIAEILMLIFNKYLVFAYLVIAGIFLTGFILRVVRLYPGEKEPLLLDGLAVILAIIFAHLAGVLAEFNLRFLLILCSSIIVLPHLIYIYKMIR